MNNSVGKPGQPMGFAKSVDETSLLVTRECKESSLRNHGENLVKLPSGHQ